MAISIPLDANNQPMLIGTLNTDGTTVVAIKVNPATHGIKYVDDTTGSSFTTTNVQRDANRKPAIWGVSSVDGVTPVSIYTDSSGNLLIDST